MTFDDVLSDLQATLQATVPGQWLPPLVTWAHMADKPPAWVYRKHSPEWVAAVAEWRSLKAAYLAAQVAGVLEKAKAGVPDRQIHRDLDVRTGRVRKIREAAGLGPIRRTHDWGRVVGYITQAIAQDGRVHVRVVAHHCDIPYRAVDTWGRRNSDKFHYAGGFFAPKNRKRGEKIR